MMVQAHEYFRLAQSLFAASQQSMQTLKDKVGKRCGLTSRQARYAASDCMVLLNQQLASFDPAVGVVLHTRRHAHMNKKRWQASRKLMVRYSYDLE